MSHVTTQGSSSDMRMFITEAISSTIDGKLTTADIYKWLQHNVAGLAPRDCEKIKWQVGLYMGRSV